MKNPAILSGLEPQYAEKLKNLLNGYLANLHVVYMKIRNFHWNVVGIDFIDFHEKLGEIYEAVADEIDYVAERIRQIGYHPLGSMAEMIQHATLKEASSTAYNTATIASALAYDFGETAKYLRMMSEEIAGSKDENTINHLGEALQFLEKYIWFFTAYLEGLNN